MHSSGLQKANFWLAGVGRYIRNISAGKTIQANAKEECRAEFGENGKYYNYKSADIQIISYLNKYLKTLSKVSRGLGSVKLITVYSETVYSGEFLNI